MTFKKCLFDLLAMEQKSFNFVKAKNRFLTDDFDVTKIVIDDTLTKKNLPIYVCYQNCLEDLKSGQIPVFSKFNGMNVDEIPVEI